MSGMDKGRSYVWWVKPHGKTKPAQIAVVAWGGKAWLSDALMTWDGRWQDLGKLGLSSIWWYGPIEAPEGP